MGKGSGLTQNKKEGSPIFRKQTIAPYYALDLAYADDNSTDQLLWEPVYNDQDGKDAPKKNNTSFTANSRGDLYINTDEMGFEAVFKVTMSGAMQAGDTLVHYGDCMHWCREANLSIDHNKVERIEHANVTSFIKGNMMAQTKQLESIHVADTSRADVTADSVDITNFSYNRAYDMKNKHGIINGSAGPEDETDTVRYFRYWIPISYVFPYFKWYPIVHNGVSIKVDFDIINDMSIPFKNISTVTISSVEFETLKLWVPYVKPSPETYMALSKFKNTTGTRPIEWTTVNVYQKENVASETANFQIAPDVKNPEFVVCFTRNNDVGTSNPYVASDSSFRSGKLIYNGHHVPQTDFDVEREGGWQRLYSEFLKVCGHGLDSADSNVLDYNTFRRVYRYVCFDLRSLPEDVLSISHGASMRFNAIYDSNDAKHIYFLVFRKAQGQVSYEGADQATRISGIEY